MSNFKMAKNVEEIIFPLPMLIGSLVEIFFFCELGERITNQFRKIDEEVWTIQWYTLPIEVQKIYAMIMIGTQLPVMLIGIGDIECTRKAFKNVSIEMRHNFVSASIYLLSGVLHRIFILHIASENLSFFDVGS